MNKILLIAGALVFGAFSANAQCTDFTAGPYGDFNPAPCNGESEEITAFEVYAAENYAMEGIIAGGEYAFSICNGPGAGTWVADFTIVAPSGAVDAFGAGDGDGCTISWTATEDGVYAILINEEGNCGVANAIDNGNPMMTTISGGADCATPPVVVDGAESFEGGVLPECWSTMNIDGDDFDWNVLESADLAFDGDFSMRSESYDNTVGPLTPDNYLITPQLELGAGADSLYYAIAAVDGDYAAENYSVLVSTTGTDIADFTDEVFTEVLASDVYEGRSIDMAAYANQTIYIAFRHFDVTDQFSFVIDVVALPGVVNCNPDAVAEVGALASVEVFPNPSTGVFNVVNNGAADTYQIRVYDMSGKQVATEQVVLSNGAQHQINLSDVATGVYTLQFVSSTESGTIRVVKN